MKYKCRTRDVWMAAGVIYAVCVILAIIGGIAIGSVGAAEVLAHNESIQDVFKYGVSNTDAISMLR